MIGNITEEQFRKFCKDFVEKYEGRNFSELVKSLGYNWTVQYLGNVNNNLKIVYTELCLCCDANNDSNNTMFGYLKDGKKIFINSYGLADKGFYTIEDIYKFFKMDVKETIEITLEINLEDILRVYKEDISKKLGLSLENIKINLKRG